jgi:hypothetical protein
MPCVMASACEAPISKSRSLDFQRNNPMLFRWMIISLSHQFLKRTINHRKYSLHLQCCCLHPKAEQMTHTPTTIRFNENGLVQEIISRVQSLRKEQSGEFLYTSDGHRIMIEHIISMGSVQLS